MKTHVTVSISFELAERINAYSKKREIPKSQIHTEAITAWLRQEEKKPKATN